MIFSKKDTPIEAAAEKPIPAPLSAPVKYADDVHEWLNVAGAIGATPQAVAGIELDLWLNEQFIPVFNTGAVFDFLTAKARAAKTTFGLHGLRACDLPDPGGVWLALSHPWPPEYKQHSGRHSYSVIPLPVLLTAAKVIDKFGARARLYVTYMANIDDPFLGVSVDNCSVRFIERWDEPTFRGK